MNVEDNVCQRCGFYHKNIKLPKLMMDYIAQDYYNGAVKEFHLCADCIQDLFALFMVAGLSNDWTSDKFGFKRQGNAEEIKKQKEREKTV